MGHQARGCPTTHSKKHCTYCQNPCHNTHECPFVWRRYIFKREINLKPIARVSCSWCGSAGHFQDECPGGRSLSRGLYSLNSIIPPTGIPYSENVELARYPMRRPDEKDKDGQARVFPFKPLVKIPKEKEAPPEIKVSKAVYKKVRKQFLQS
jgi:hypothetical protein